MVRIQVRGDVDLTKGGALEMKNQDGLQIHFSGCCCGKSCQARIVPYFFYFVDQ